MKLLKLSLLLAGVCCVSNSYAMETNKQDLSKKLSQANKLIESAEDVLRNKNMRLMLAHFGSVKAANEYSNAEDTKAIEFVEQAKNLTQSVLDDKAVPFEVKDSAELSLQRICSITKDLKNVNK
jgi:hypothetical protein